MDNYFFFLRRGKYSPLVTDTERDNCFSICPVSEWIWRISVFKCSKIVKNALYLKKSARTVTHECQKVNSGGYLLFIVQSERA